MLLAIDPGHTQSALVVLDGTTIVQHAIMSNRNALDYVERYAMKAAHEGWDMAVEMIGVAGVVGKEVFETVFWIGRFVDRFDTTSGRLAKLLLRKTIVSHLCGTSRANDATVRQTLIDRYGGDSVALAGKRCQRCRDGMTKTKVPKQCTCCDGTGWATKRGPLHGIAKDVWSALAVGTAFNEGAITVTL